MNISLAIPDGSTKLAAVEEKYDWMEERVHRGSFKNGFEPHVETGVEYEQVED
jgi:hypothetical protein